ncbi:MAG: hypothetical protein WAP07_08000 [Acutalibacteraceae bacterium]
MASVNITQTTLCYKMRSIRQLMNIRASVNEQNGCGASRRPVAGREGVGR